MPQVLVLNSGSSSIKYQLIDLENNAVLASGLVEQIGEESGRIKHISGGEEYVVERFISNHEDGLTLTLESFAEFGPELNDENLTAVGHRVVHGGDKFSQPTLITDDVENEIERLSALAPLHNPANLKGIRVARKVFATTPHVAVFDTAFHQTLEPASYTYAIDHDVAAKYGIRRYGFHGTSHAFVSQKAAEFLGKPAKDLNLIILHLGNGGSATAVRGGKSVETSMGLTPLEGLVMGTRSGDIDAGVIFHLYRQAGMSMDEIDTLLNKKSGMMGVSGGMTDMRDLHAAVDEGNESANLALETYYRRVRQYIGSYYVLLGRVDVIVFTAGVGENDDIARFEITKNLENLGILVDAKLNEGRVKEPKQISTKDSKVAVLVIPTNEELAIAEQAIEIAASLQRSAE